MFRRVICIGIAVFLAISAFSFASAATKIRVGYVVDINKIPFFVAMDKGFFRELGLEIEEKDFISGRDSLTAFKGGNLDIMVTMGANSIAKYYSRGIGVYMIRAWSLPHFKMIALKEAPIKTLKDLKGKKYAVTSFAGTTYAISSMAFHAMGMDIQKDVEIKTFPPAVMRVELERGGVDAGILWEPLLSKALKAGNLRVILNPGAVYVEKFKKRFFHTGVGCTKAFFDSQRDAVRKYIQAVEKGIAYTLKNPDEANDILAARWKGYTSGDIAKLRKSWGDGWITEGINDKQIQEMQFMYDKMFELTKYFKKRPNASEVMKKP